jgi:DNA-directed RNA polymerase subunit E'/Rpb7
MKSEAGGKITLEAEVTQIDKQGIWILIGEKEYFLPHEQFPQFRKATVDQIHNVQLVDNRDLHWPDLKINLLVESIGKPQHVPQFVKAE